MFNLPGLHTHEPRFAVNSVLTYLNDGMAGKTIVQQTV